MFARPQHDVLGQFFEVGWDAGEDRIGQLGAVGVAVEFVVGGGLDAVLRFARLGDHLVEALMGRRELVFQGQLLDHRFDVRQLALQPSERFAEKAQRLVQAGDRRAQPLGRHEVDDLHGDHAADAIEATDALLDEHRVPRQVEQDQPRAEFEVAPLAAAFGRDQHRRPRRRSELRDLDIPFAG